MKTDQEPSDEDLDDIENNFTEELFEDIDKILEGILLEDIYGR